MTTSSCCLLDADGQVGLVLGFEVTGTPTHNQLHPLTAIEIARTMSDWLDRHSEDLLL